MKFTTLILFGLLAFAFADEKVVKSDLDILSQDTSIFQTGLFEKVSQASEDFVKTIANPFRAAHKKSKEILERAYARIDNAHAKAQGSFNAILTAFEAKFTEYEDGCVNEIKKDYESVKAHVHNQLQLFADNKKGELQVQESPIEQQLEEIDERIEEYRLVAVTCFNFNPVVTTECVFNKMSEYSKVIGEIGTTFNKAVTDVTTSSITAQRDVVTHNSKTVKSSMSALGGVSQALSACPKKQK